jgi:nucleoside-diphosphate-sugar epimerase
MNVVIAGGHGQIGLLLAKKLVHRGVAPTGLIRNPAHATDVQAAGGWPVVCDLEHITVDEVAGFITGFDAVVFAAGAGPGSGAARKDTVDRAASALMADAAQRAGVRRFIQISSMGAGQPPQADRGEVWAAYIEAKTQAEHDLRARDLDWLILRPGRLTNEPGTGHVTLAEPPIESGEVTREDVASVIASLLITPHISRRTLELVQGPTPIDEAVNALLR